MARLKSNKPKRNIWADPSPYGTYAGEAGNPEHWRSAFEYATYSREKSLWVLKEVDQTPYEILGVSCAATQDEIKTAWKKLIIIYHPDKSTGDREKFEQVMAAYSILKS